MSEREEDIEIFDPETGNLNFDVVMNLYRDNPEELERLQQKAVRELIDSAPEAYQRRLNGLQFQVDTTRQLAKNTTHSYLELSKLFWSQGFNKFQDALNGELEKPKPKGSSDNVVDINSGKPESSL